MLDAAASRYLADMLFHDKNIYSFSNIKEKSHILA